MDVVLSCISADKKLIVAVMEQLLQLLVSTDDSEIEKISLITQVSQKVIKEFQRVHLPQPTPTPAPRASAVNLVLMNLMVNNLFAKK